VSDNSDKKGNLEEQEQRYRSFYKYSKDALLIISPPDWRVMDVNPAFLKMFKFKSEKDLGKSTPFDLSPKFQPDGKPSKEKALEMIRVAMEKGSNFFEWTHKRKDKSEFPANVLLTRFKLNGINVIQGTIRDISEIKSMEMHINKEHARLQLLMETGPIGITFVNADGKISYANHTAKEILGLSKEKIGSLYYNSPAFRITDFEGNPFPNENLPFSIVLKTKKPIKNIEHAIEWANGKHVFLSINGAPLISKEGDFLGMVATFEDITEKKNAENKILLEKAIFETESDASMDGILMVDEKCKVLSLNKQFERIFKVKERAWKKKGLEERLKVYSKKIKNYDFFAENIRHFYSDSGRNEKSEFEITLFDKRILDVESFPIIDSNGRYYGRSLHFHDISDIKKAQEALKKANDELIQLDSAKTNFLNMASHELKTPLTAITAHLDVLDYLKSNLNEQELISLNAIKRNNRLIKMLIENILETSRIESGKFELNYSRIDINSLINDVAGDLRILSENKGLALKIEMEALPLIHADEIRIREVLSNLIVNAIKFTESGSVTIKAMKEERSVRVEITDTGSGIPEDKIGTLFEDFHQINSSAAREYGGTGLGLSISKQLVELHNGKINVTSEFRKGSTFSFIIPINHQNKSSKKKRRTE
jgi:PAS domain S-box-containing protein